MFSVISTGTCWRPLCTAMVRPTISGTTVERRDQVLIGLRSFLAEATCTFLARCRSTNGPFFNERGMWRSQSADAVLAALDDHVVGALVVTGLQSLGVLAPRRHRVRVALAGLALAATVRVIDRVHGQPAHRRAYALPALGAGLAVAAQVVLVVPHFTDGGAAVDVHLAGLAGLEAQVCIDALARSEGHGTAGAARQLPAAPGLHLDVVDDRADRNVPQRHGVARLDRGVGAGAHFIARLHALGREDVAPLAVGDRKSTRLNSSHSQISYAVFCFKTKRRTHTASTLRANHETRTVHQHV